MAEKIIEFDRVVAGYSESLTILNETTLDVRKGERIDIDFFAGATRVSVDGHTLGATIHGRPLVDG